MADVKNIRWTIVGKGLKKGHVLCRCSCEARTEKEVAAHSISSGQSRSCGCLRRELSSRTAVKQQYGRLTVIRRSDRKHPKKTFWVCECACTPGRTIETCSSSLRTGHTRSCGCILQEKYAAARSATDVLLHRRWCSMLTRCLDETSKSYKSYGGRGIDVDPRWIASYEVFRDDVGYPRLPELQLDRIDNNRGYWPNNVRWVDTETQANNRRVTILMTLNGLTKPLSEWAKASGISAKVLRNRRRRGWTDEEALTTPRRVWSEL